MIAYAPSSHRNFAGTALTLIGLALLLTGCIKPDAAPLNATAPAIPAIGQTANAPLTQATPLPTVQLPTAPPLPTIASNSISTPLVQGLPLAADGIWKTQPVGPESVIIMFFHDPGGATCIRTIFRSVATARCASPGQALAIIAGNLKTADNADYTIIAGRALDGQVSRVVVEFSAGVPPQQVAISGGGFITVNGGVQHPTDAAPVNQAGNLIGGKIAF